MATAAITLSISFADLLRAFVRIGLLSFGGPAGQIALMHRELVEERRWIGEEDFLHALNYCHLLPGPEAQQLTPWIDRLSHAVRLKGGLAAVTAAVVGVIANLTAWFVLHVLFAQVGRRDFGPLQLYWPDTASFDWRAGVLAVLACVLAFGLKWSVLRVLAAAALGGLVLVLAF